MVLGGGIASERDWRDRHPPDVGGLVAAPSDTPSPGISPSRALCSLYPGARDALEGKGPQRRPQKPLDRRLEEVAKAVGGGYCRLQMPLRLALGIRGTVAGHRLGALEEGGGYLPPSNASLTGAPGAAPPRLTSPPQPRVYSDHAASGSSSPRRRRPLVRHGDG